MEDGRYLDCIRDGSSRILGRKSSNLRDATSHLGEKINRSANGAVRSRDLAVSTQKIDGSMWSTEIEPTLTNLVRSYL